MLQAEIHRSTPPGLALEREEQGAIILGDSSDSEDMSMSSSDDMREDAVNAVDSPSLETAGVSIPGRPVDLPHHGQVPSARKRKSPVEVRENLASIVPAKKQRLEKEIRAMPLSKKQTSPDKLHPHEIDIHSGEVKALQDKDWDDAQAPLRAHISMYADQIIRDAWNDGNDVDRDASPRFAVQVLLHVRSRFYAQVAREAAAARAAGRAPIQDPPKGPFTRKLTLENMKWLFEVKVKPHTESYGKEIFLCNGCNESLKTYGFEGVIQHYAAKHTTSMSIGSIVVYWRSEWPETPPFHPDPVAKIAQARTHRNASSRPSLVGDSHQHGHSHRQFTSSHALPIAHTGPPQHDWFMQTEGQFQPGPWGPPSFSVPPYHSPYPHLPGAHHPAFDELQSIAPTPGGPQLPLHYPQCFGVGVPGPAIANDYYHPYDAHRLVALPGYPVPSNGLQTDLMRTQREELVRGSRQIWLATAGIKELPGYVRVYVFLHHLAKCYRTRFSESPPLPMFIDGLSNYKEMRPVRNVNGLMCKACHLGSRAAVTVEIDRTGFSLPQLVKHFQQKHLESLQAVGRPLLDWIVDMVFLADLPSLSGLKGMVGMDNRKYQLVTEAFPPALFPALYDARGPPYHSDPSTCQVDTIVPDPNSLHNPTSVSRPSVYGLAPSYAHENTPSSYRQDDHTGLSSVPQLANSNPHTERPAADPDQTSSNNFTLVTEDHAALHNVILKNMDRHNGKGSAEPPADKHPRRNFSGKERRSRRSKSRLGNMSKDESEPVERIAENTEIQEDKEAEAEARREEEAIRAMWAAERKAAACTPSTCVTTQQSQSQPFNVSVEKELQESTWQPAELANSNHSKEPAVSTDRHKSPSVVADHDDLFSSLEMYLEQQCEARLTDIVTTSTASANSPIPDTGRDSRRTQEFPVPSSGTAHKHRKCEPPSCESNPKVDLSLRHCSRGESSRLNGPELKASRAVSQMTPVAFAPKSQAPTVHYPDDNNNNRGVARADGVAVYDETPLQHLSVASSYTNTRLTEQTTMTDPLPIQYTEVYERILIRDSRGDEYYIERPVRRGLERVYVRYEDEELRYRENPIYSNYEQVD